MVIFLDIFIAYNFKPTFSCESMLLQIVVRVDLEFFLDYSERCDDICSAHFRAEQNTDYGLALRQYNTVITIFGTIV